METIIYFVAAGLLVTFVFVVFHTIVRREYRHKGRLTLTSSLFELLVWGLYFSFPYLYNPPQWPSFWVDEVPVSVPFRVIGIVCIINGMVVAFGTMLWFGLRRAFGLQVTGLIQRGPYQVTRNPQIIGGILLVLGTVVLWPSWYAAGWVALYGIVAHLMVMTEEEHLLREYGEEYTLYTRRVPRYIGF